MSANSKDYQKEWASFLSPAQIHVDQESRKIFGKDWTTYFETNAEAIVFPESTEQVQKLVKWARHNKVALVPSGGRTGLSGGACATNHEIVVSFSRMNKIKSFSALDHTVVIEPGVITENLQNWAKEKGLFYPVDFAARGSSQMGGNIATNAGGIKVLRYGMTRQWVTGLKVVTGTGDILELNRGLTKNATGYDFRHLFIGSEGTLGFVVEATIQLVSPPPPLKLMILGVSGLDAVMKIFSEFKIRTQLTAFEMFSELALSKVIEHTHLPRPLAEKSPYYLLAEVEAGHQDAEERCLAVFEKSLNEGWAQDGAMAQSDTQARDFWRLREDITESTAPYTPYKNDISVTVAQVPAFLQDLDQVLSKAYPKWEVVWFGHVGDGNLHINILRPKELSKEQFLAECRKVDPLVFASVKKFGGAISAEHGVGLTKKDYLGFSRSPAEIELMRGIKRVFDPDGIMNPGKLI